MQSHRFKLGDSLVFVPERMNVFAPVRKGSATTLGLVEVTRFLPSDGREMQYRVKALAGGQERVVRESQLRLP
ncbi:MAG: hypothetical protein RLY86_597 [Pseudomonadota bacterium]